MEREHSLQQQPNAVSPTNIRDDWDIAEPVIIPVSEPVLNGGPPMCNRTPTPIHTEPPGIEKEKREFHFHPGEKTHYLQKIKEQRQCNTHVK